MLTALNGSRLPFASDPPKHRSCSNQDNQGEQYDQRGFLDPGDRRHEKRHDDPEYANLPGQNVHAGNKGAESQQEQNSEAGCISIHHVLHAGKQQEIHGGKEGEPMRDLSPDQAELFFFSRADRQPLQIQRTPVTGTRNSQKAIVGRFVKLV
jgi:hypothetical protein